MSNFYIGQRVVCVRSGWDRGVGEKYPVKGRVYTVRDKLIGSYGSLVIRLVEVVNEPSQYRDRYAEVAFPSGMFRPVVTRPTSIEIFRSLLTNTEQENRRQLEVKEHERAETALFDPFTETPWQRPFQ